MLALEDITNHFEAQEIFDQFEPDEIGVHIFKYPEVVFDRSKQRHVLSMIVKKKTEKDSVEQSLENILKTKHYHRTT